MTNIDPSTIPFRTLENGEKIPAIGLGTFGSDKYSGAEVAAAVYGAVMIGYRHIDCAAVYGNEREIGKALHDLSLNSIRRETLWITSKVWNDRHNDVIGSCEQSLRDLRLDYLDLFLVHWPFPHHHAPGVSAGSRDPHARPYNPEKYLETWRSMESLVQRGLVRNIGTSNMTVPKLELLLTESTIRPAVNEMELHPHFQQPELFDYVVRQNIVPIGYSPFGSPSRPARDRAPGDSVDLEDPILLQVAEEHEISPASVAIKWAIQRGQVPIPFSVKPTQYIASLAATISSPLSSGEMEAIKGIDRGCRLIKGQVFLWEGAKDWEDLWDVNGTIVG